MWLVVCLWFCVVSDIYNIFGLFEHIFYFLHKSFKAFHAAVELVAVHVYVSF